MATFTKWLGMVLNQSELEIRRTLNDDTALHFLIAWSLFEARCFEKYVQAKKLRDYAETVASQGFSATRLSPQFDHFYNRYCEQPRSKTQLSNLLHDAERPTDVGRAVRECLEKQKLKFTAADRIFLVCAVIYRFRNNMFHGSKGVQSWLRYKQEIELCTLAMQELILHAESITPVSSKLEAAQTAA